MKTFGEFVKTKRIENRISLREFCRRIDYDASNWSKIEREFTTPPKDELIIEKIAKVLQLSKGSEEYSTLFDLAAIAFIPKNLMDDEQLLENLPVFFRTIRGEAPTMDELKLLIKTLKEE